MLRFNIPKDNINERKYIISVLLDFLGLKYEISFSNVSSYQLLLENGNEIIFEDHFFSKHPKPLSYLHDANIPQSVSFVKNDFIPENDIPVIYGNDKLEVSENKIICGIDIFASSFFMLSRWEEYVNRKRDAHDRFPFEESLAYRNGFLQRPVVNEYVEMLWNMLVHLGIKEKRKSRKLNLLLSHDVDVALKYYSLRNGAKELAADLFKKKSLKSFFYHLSNKIKTHLTLRKDDYDTYDFLMSFSEKTGVKSYFFFMTGGKNSYDAKYRLNDKRIKDIVARIQGRGHNIGLHPSYDAYKNLELLSKEKDILEQYVGKVTCGRNHFLRFEVPYAWQIWNDSGMEWDSTMGYAGKNGFRCGVCFEYNVFNVLTREKLNLKEKPLIIMDTTYWVYVNKSEDEIEKDLKSLISATAKYNGECVVLWHNSNIEQHKVWDVFVKVLAEVV